MRRGGTEFRQKGSSEVLSLSLSQLLCCRKGFEMALVLPAGSYIESHRQGQDSKDYGMKILDRHQLKDVIDPW